MTEIQTKAVEKIKTAKKPNGQREGVIFTPTADALISFCEQSEEFSSAVLDGKGFDECIKEICNGIGGACSDLEVYTKAVGFYFPGAVIDFNMKIRMSEYEPKNIINLDFSSLL